jgi:hypothetical protein
VSSEIPESTVCIHEQMKTGVFVNTGGQIVVRQEATNYGDDDHWIIVSKEHVPALVAAIEAAAASPEAGFTQFEDDPDPEPEPVADAPPPAPEQPPLPLLDDPEVQREQIRAALRAGDVSNRQIARDLGCSEATVRRVAATLVRQSCDSTATPVRQTHPESHPDAVLTHPIFRTKEERAA